MIRKPAVAGMFYPADPAKLNHDVDQMLTEATQVAETVREAAVDGGATAVPTAQHFPERVLRAVIVPHAGYIYSGLTAATAYALVGEVQKEGQEFDCAVIVGPTHRVGIAGCAYPTATAFATPLGEVPLLRGIAQSLSGVPGVTAHDETHQDEHAIEVQLPFLQKVLPETPIVPINAGQIRQEVLADVVEQFLTENTLLVISSDLSHYLPYDVANELDALTLGQILSLGGPLQHEQACGATPVNGVIELARRHGWYPELLAACNSGDTAGDKDRVVGYCAIAFFEAAPEPELDLDFEASSEELDSATSPEGYAQNDELGEFQDTEPGGSASAASYPESLVQNDDQSSFNTEPDGNYPSSGPQSPSSCARSQDIYQDDTVGSAGALSAEAGEVLLAQARDAIERKLGFVYDPPEPWGDWAELRTGTFVTLTKDGELRGCIGSLVDERPLSVSVPANALNAAFADPRFNPMTPAEWPDIDLEVSVLTSPSPILVEDGDGGFRAPATEAEALAALQPGVDGVIFSARGRQSTFLPQVWEQLPEPKQFLDHLRAKAGLPPDYWGDDVELLRYHVQAFKE